METPEVAKMLKAEDIFELKQDELRTELEKLGQDVKGLTKLQMQKALLKLVSSPYSSPKAKESEVKAESLQLKLAEIARIQQKEDREAERQFELEKFKIQTQMEADAKKEQAQIEAKFKMEQAELESRRLEKEFEAKAQVKKEEIEAMERKIQMEAQVKKEEAEAMERKMHIEAQVKKEEEERRIQVKKEEAEATERKLRVEADILERKLRVDNETTTTKLSMENEAKRMQIEADERKLQMELAEKEKQRQHQLQMKELGGSFERLTGGYFEDGAQGLNEENAERTGHTSKFNIASAVKFVPRFDDTNLEHYLQSFEKAMELHQFPKDKWSSLIHTKLTGKALQIFGELSLEQCKDYDVVKKSLLTAYSRVPEFYRKRFRELQKGNLETYSNFAYRLNIPFKSWLEGEGALSDLDKALEIFKLEQFVNCLPGDLHRWIIERKVTTLSEAARMADEYDLLYKPFRKANVAPVKFEKGWANDTANVKRSGGQNSWGSPKNTARNYTGAFGTPVTCAYCHARSHSITNCEKLKARNLACANTNYSDNNIGLVDVQSGNPTINQQYRPFVKDGLVYGRQGSQRHVVLLRDSGALQSIVSRDGLNPSDYVLTGDDRLIQGIVGEPVNVPLVEIQLESEWVSGTVLCGLVDKLPKGINMLIGYDLMQKEPIDVAVVTRAQSKLGTTMQSSVDRQDAANVDAPIIKSSDVIDSVDLNLNDLFTEDVDSHVEGLEFCTRERLIELQRSDESFNCLFDLARSPDRSERSFYEVRDGVLIRVWRNVLEPEGFGRTQVIVPISLRPKIIHVAHDVPSSGHLGTQKTLDRVLRHFYWPGIFKYVREYCRTCDVCQRLGKGATKARAPLINLPVIDKPWSRIALDIVGPLDICDKSGNRFLLTIMDLGTHFPLAFPLKVHTAVEVAKVLVSVFTTFGFPDEVLTDQGSEFMSELMQLLMNECQIIQLKTSAFHPMTNGCLERFHRTLKDMLKAVGETFQGDWDEILPWVLFAYREVPVQGLGFSAFDLMFGRDVKGPLQMIKHSWLRTDVVPKLKNTNLIDFVLDLREKIKVSLQIANNNEMVHKSKSKEWYDLHAKSVTFEKGEQALLLLPLIGKPLQAKYCGPYQVLKRLGEVDYLVGTPDRRKTKRVVHVNLMKRYLPRQGEKVMVVDIEPETHVLVTDASTPTSFLESVNMDHLNQSQIDDLTNVLCKFQNVFSDKPGKTTLVSHDVKLMEGVRPMRQSPYPLHPERLKLVNKEIEELLQEGIIEESESPWAAPIVLVPKPDGTLRLCTDFRKLNAVTVPDPFPMPRVETLINKVGQAKFLTKLDMTKDYWQIPVAPSAREVTAFVTSNGHFQWKYMAFGLRNAPSSFSRLVKKVFAGLESFCDAYLDDVIIFSMAWSNHMDHLRQVLQRVENAKLTLNVKKCIFANAEVDFLGHHVGRGIVSPRSQKVEVMLNFPTPTNKKQLQSLHGLASYYRKYLPHFAELTEPFTEILKKGNKFVWSDKAERAFVDLKSRLASKPILKPPDYNRPFFVAVDASQVCIGACLFQIHEDIEHPVCYYSRKLRKHEVKWMMYWIVFAIFTFVETFADMVVAWIPFYFEMKICFILWLIMPATKGSSVLYRKAVHPQLVKREKEIDNYINRASDHGYSALIALGSRGFSFATNMVLSTAIKGQTKLADHLSRSFSLSDLSDTSRELEQFNRRESTTSIDSNDGVDSRRILQDIFRREMDNEESPRIMDNVHDLSSEIDGGSEENLAQLSGSQSVPATTSHLTTAEDNAKASVLINRYLRSASLDTTRMTPGAWHAPPNLFTATTKK